MILGSNENPTLWKENICNAIKDLANIEVQKLTWSGKHPKYISSFTETLSALYDDFDFERYIEYHKSTKGEDEFYKIISELNSLLNEYKKFGYEAELMAGGYVVILNDVNWINITNKAKEVCLSENCKKMPNDRSLTHGSNA